MENNRRTGKTTRLIDESIQLLFNNGAIIIPYMEETNFNGQKDNDALKIIDESLKYKPQNYIAKRIVRRLESEHPDMFIVTDKVYGVLIEKKQHT